MKKTVENLTKAFVGESIARNRYSMYASIAKKEGYEQIAEIFRLTSDQEKEHASQLYKMLVSLQSENNFDGVKIETDVPILRSTTIENLKSAISGENYEHSEMYPEFAKVADEEGLPQVANRLRAIAVAEVHHEERYKKILAALEAGEIFKKKEAVWWVCRECGYMHFGTEAPEICPSCDHARSYYQLKCEEF
ncbi:rubrerythrin [Candidatus Methanomassiliicoccus intestinalis]|uniref:rubrerythrin n=1 Tax=Candidatus Methanomassiliicoccus intestinalis TaxID=1406512 RepID=UPI0037DD3BA0